MLNFVAFLFVIFTSLVVGTPIPGSDDIWTKYSSFNDHSNSSNPHSVTGRDVLKPNVGPEINDWLYRDWTYCVANPGDSKQCTLSVFDTDEPDMGPASMYFQPKPKVWLFDNNCKVIGSNMAAPRGEMETPGGWAFASEKSWYVVLHFVGKHLSGTRDVSWMYRGKKILPSEGELWRKWQDGYSWMYHSGRHHLYRWAWEC